MQPEGHLHPLTQVIGIVARAFRELGFDIDWFFVNTEAITFIGLALVAITLLFIILGRTITGDKKLLSFDLLCFTFLYSFIAPLWLVKSVYNTLLSKEASWR